MTRDLMEMVRGQTGLTEQEINDLGRSINIQQFDKPEEAERIIKAAEAQLPGSVDLYQDIRSQTGLNYAEIEDLAGSINIRNLDKPGEVTRIVEAHNTVNPTVPNPDDTPTPTPTPSPVPQSDYDTLLQQYQDLQNSYAQNISDAVSSATQGFADQISGMQDNFTSQLQEYQEEMAENQQLYQNQYQTMQTNYEDRLQAQETDFLAQLDARNRREADAQLAGVRAGSSQSATSSTQGQADLTSGQTQTAAEADRRSGMNVQPKIDATDSVLNRDGPVVQLINRVTQRRPSGGGRSPLAGGGGANYYASRFG